MIIHCPFCQTRFVIEAASIKAKGRQIRCSKCGGGWRQAYTELSEKQMIVEERTVPYIEGLAGKNESEFQKIDLEYSNEENSKTSPSSLDAFTDNLNENHTVGEAFNSSGTRNGNGGQVKWLLLVISLFGLGAAGYFYQKSIVVIWPPAGQLYKMIGLAPMPKSITLSIQNVKWDYKTIEGTRILFVSGQVTNQSASKKSVPRLHIAIRDKHNLRLIHWTATADLHSIEPGQHATFTSRLADPPRGANSLAVTLQKPS